MATRVQVDAAHKKLRAAIRAHEKTVDRGYTRGRRELTNRYDLERVDNRIRRLNQKRDEAVQEFRRLLREYATETGQSEGELRDYYSNLPRQNPRGGRTMARRTTRKSNPRAADRWGVYVKSQLAYVSTKKLDANKAASRLRLSGRANISIKQVGPNPISGIVPKVGWRAEFKKAAYSAMKAPGVRRKRARTTSKIRQTRQRRGENPRRSNPSFTEWIVEGKTFYSLSGDKRSEAIAYAKRLADERGTNVQLTTIKGYAQRDPSGFIYDSTEDSETTITVRPKRRRNAAGPSSRAVAGRIGRAVGARVKSGNPVKEYGVPGGTGPRGWSYHRTLTTAKSIAQSRANKKGSPVPVYKYDTSSWEWMSTYIADPSSKRNPRRAGVGTRSVMRGGTFRGAVGRKRTNPVRRTGASGFGAVVAEVTDKSGRLIGRVKWTGSATKSQRYAWELVDTTAGRYSGYSSTESGAVKKIKGNWNAYLKKFGRPEDSPFYRKRNAPSILRRRNPRLTDTEARSILSDLGIGVNDDVHTLSSSTMDKVVDAARKYGYRKPKTASGSTGRYFVEHLQRKARPRAFSGYRGTRNPHTTTNHSSGYVVQVGNTVAWVGKLSADAQKAMRKLMAGGRKGVKGFAAKLPVGIKRGWRSQFKAVSRKRNASFGKGKLGSGSRFKSCVRTMKRRGVASPSGLCASIGRRKYGAKRMAGMAKRGRARRSNPPKFYRIAYTMPSGKRHAGLISANSLADATQYYKRVMLREFPDGSGGTKASRLTIRRAKGTEIPKVYR